MKKQLAIGISAVLLALATSRPADAWINAKISVGVNWNWRSGDNYLFGGIFSNCETPLGHGLYDFGPPPAHVPPGFGAMPQATTPNAPGHGYSRALYSSYGSGFYYPASYQPSYYGSGHGTDPSPWYYRR